ncbi:hypothetical protein O8E88_002296 [Flavobacterium psychrophilum]|uniref:hypothetical protein n=1 Tax=Flavobacterium psychrophilum TaxID=96345 RepID=UPI0004F6EF19|nr:hypothetical protein [Flavobacterium psychrophilum]AIN75176.1 hypothetical protein FPG3_07120 [Flavobacterium psychrophilum FPG3]EKT2070468.1 hypothetical protein [Flavobacterium psychrophilum]EKT2072810.1 hypothetical protein [Flavobacterium psychrophilum]EKT4492270.1 hypothetical protein [Flavobacterium psychrophilum]MBF2045178.1 hypothetical protein [Flavobacterium psychrophilum]
MSNKEKDFEQLHSDWRNISINQLSFTNNLILTFSSGFFIYIFSDKKIPDFHINTNENFVYTKFAFAFCIIFLLLSIIYGIAILFTRLYDFRITRNILFARSRTNNQLEYIDFSEFTFNERVSALWKILFKKLPFLTREDAKKSINDKEFIKKFEELLKLSKILGTSSWLWTKFQILHLSLSFILYLIFLFLN